jgi:hypothetical protein
VVGLITNNDETAYREEVRDLAGWCQNNNLSLNIIKTKEMIVDYRKRRTEHTPILINGAVVELVESFKFLGVHITKNGPNTPRQSGRGHDKADSPSDNWHGSSDPQKFLQLHHQLHCLVRQLLGPRPQGTSDGRVYGPVHHWG